MPELDDNSRIWRHMIAGAGSGWMTSFITCPLDVVKVRLQTSDPVVQTSGTSTFKLLRRIWNNEGLRGMYRGLGLTMIGYLPSFSIYFPTYHYFKLRLSKFQGKRPETDSLAHVLSAMIAGAATNLSTNPLWVIRTRLMTQHVVSEKLYKNSFDAFQSILRNEGVRGFYKGASASVIGVAHVAVQFPLYEWLKQIQRVKRQGLGFVDIFLASTVSKVIASSVTYPHEVIRTRLQIQRDGLPKYIGFVDACKKILREEGLIGFYRGLKVNVMRVIPASGVTFITYETILKYS